jgi:hypothetical protein
MLSRPVRSSRPAHRSLRHIPRCGQNPGCFIRYVPPFRGICRRAPGACQARSRQLPATWSLDVHGVNVYNAPQVKAGYTATLRLAGSYEEQVHRSILEHRGPGSDPGEVDEHAAHHAPGARRRG